MTAAVLAVVRFLLGLFGGSLKPSPEARAARAEERVDAAVRTVQETADARRAEGDMHRAIEAAKAPQKPKEDLREGDPLF